MVLTYLKKLKLKKWNGIYQALICPLQNSRNQET